MNHHRRERVCRDKYWEDNPYCANHEKFFKMYPTKQDLKTIPKEI
jgi:hypothetical protein